MAVAYAFHDSFAQVLTRHCGYPIELIDLLMRKPGSRTARGPVCPHGVERN